MSEEKMLNAYEQSLVVANAASSKKAEDTIILDVGGIIGITETFVITTGDNVRHVRAICDEVEFAMKVEADRAPRAIEGLKEATWVLLDYGDLVVHVFGRETREYYDLERLWSDAPRVAWSEDVSAEGMTAGDEKALTVG